MKEIKVTYFRDVHFHCPFCTKSYDTSAEAYECCLKNTTLENVIGRMLINAENLPSIALELNGLSEDAFKGKKKLHSVLSRMNKLENKLWRLVFQGEAVGDIFNTRSVE